MARLYGARAVAKKTENPRAIAVNKRARHRYEVLDTWEAGIVLRGTEVKSLRDGQISLDEAFGRIDGEEVFLVGAFIPEYTHGNRLNHEPTRKRKLLLHRREIKKLIAKVTQRGYTLVPLAMYWGDRGLAKLELGLCRGKRSVDKRQTMKKRDAERDIERDR